MQLDVVGPGTVTSKSSRLKLMEFCFFQLVCLSSSKHNNPHIACSTDSNMRYRMVVRLILQPGMLVSLKKEKTLKKQSNLPGLMDRKSHAFAGMPALSLEL